MNEDEQLNEGMGPLGMIAEPAKQAKLTDEELEAFAPKCVVCGDPIAAERVAKNKKTCSEEHTKVHQQYQRHRQSLRKCPSCLRPCTPEQRKDYKRWRQHRGEISRDVYDVDTPRKTREFYMREAIHEVLEALNSNTRTADEVLPFARQKLSEVISGKVTS